MARGLAHRAAIHALYALALWAPAWKPFAAPAQTAVEAWVRRYSQAADSRDYARKVVIDNAGNVIVAGYTEGGSSGRDFLTIKYSGAGVLVWTNLFNGQGNGDDITGTVAVDGSGNVFVAGLSADSGGLSDYVTLAYSESGVPLWTNRYNGPASLSDSATAVAVDGSGNVFVTGQSGAGSSTDFATVGYSAAGVPLWTNRYNHGPWNGFDAAVAVAVNGSGNVFVTGHSYSSDGHTDYLTIAYSGAGVPLWTNRYNGSGNLDDQASAVAVGSNGNALVTGYSYVSGGHPDFVTMAYSGAGVPLWTNRYNWAANSSESASALAVDASGNVFVTGYSIATGGNYDYATVAYSGAGAPLWTNRYNGPGNGNDFANAVAVDGSGNVFVTGSSVGINGQADYATVAYSGAGVPLRTNRYNGPGNSLDLARALAVDSSGNVFVTGYSTGSGGDYDYATIKYSVATLLPIPLHHQLLANQLVLSWTNAAFRLQSAPAVQGKYTDMPGATSPHSTGFSGPQRFFRLKAN